jgi:hypothetical protein
MVRTVCGPTGYEVMRPELPHAEMGSNHGSDCQGALNDPLTDQPPYEVPSAQPMESQTRGARSSVRTAVRHATGRGCRTTPQRAHGCERFAGERRGFGYRRLGLMLAREGVRLNHKKLRRLYREERLQVRRRGGRKRALGTRAPIALPAATNQRWSLDFVSDVLADGRRFRILCVVDDFTRECLALVADTSLSGARVARGLGAIVATRGMPANDRERQRHRADQHGDAALVAGARHWLALHRPSACLPPATLAEPFGRLRPASRSRTPLRRASSVACATNASTRQCSHRCVMRVRYWRDGAATTTRYGHTRGLADRRQPRSWCRRARPHQGRCAPAPPVACGQP